ncbi:homeobox protein 2-like isoform X2 [Teleopsis dalmanni]|nr:homeobox protein 2-like isoform X2 [Teleopsis dalmanni]
MSSLLPTTSTGRFDPRSFTNIYIKNFGFELTSDQLKKMFDRFGEIKNSKIMTDEEGNSKGFGFVCFLSPDSAASAVAQMHGIKISPGRVLYVAKALKKAERMHVLKYKREYEKNNLYVKNLDESVDENYMYDLFSPYGKITSLKVIVNEVGVSKGYGFVAYESPTSANRASFTLNGRMVGTKPLYVAFAQRKPERNMGLSQSRDIVNYPTDKSITPSQQYGYNTKLQHSLPQRKPSVQKICNGDNTQPNAERVGDEAADDPVIKRVDAQISINLQQTYLATKSGAVHTINIERSVVGSESENVCKDSQLNPEAVVFPSKCWGDDKSIDGNDANDSVTSLDDSNVSTEQYESNTQHNNFNDGKNFNVGSSSNRTSYSGYQTRPSFSNCGNSQGNMMKSLPLNNNRFPAPSNDRRPYNYNSISNNTTQAPRYPNYSQNNRYFSNRGAGDNKDSSSEIKAICASPTEQPNNQYKNPFSGRTRESGSNNRNSYNYGNNNCTGRNSGGLQQSTGNRTNSQYGRTYGEQINKNLYNHQPSSSRQYESSGSNYNQSRYEQNSRNNGNNQLQNRGYGQQNRNVGQNRFCGQSQQGYSSQGQYNGGNNYHTDYNGSKQRSRYANNNNNNRTRSNSQYDSVSDNSKPIGPDEVEYRNKSSSISFINSQ